MSQYASPYKLAVQAIHKHLCLNATSWLLPFFWCSLLAHSWSNCHAHWWFGSYKVQMDCLFGKLVSFCYLPHHHIRVARNICYCIHICTKVCTGTQNHASKTQVLWNECNPNIHRQVMRQSVHAADSSPMFSWNFALKLSTRNLAMGLSCSWDPMIVAWVIFILTQCCVWRTDGRTDLL